MIFRLGCQRAVAFGCIELEFIKPTGFKLLILMNNFPPFFNYFFYLIWK